jgi:hypothetical protein
MKSESLLYVLLAASLVVLATAPPAHAATVGYLDLASYTAAGGNTTIGLDFDPASSTTIVPGTSFSSQVTFTSPEYSDPSLVYHVSGPGTNGSVGGMLPGTGTFNGQLQMSFTVGYASAAFDALSNGEKFHVWVYDGANNLLLDSADPLHFFGVISDVPIKRILTEPGVFPGDGRDATAYDNLRYGPAAVIPEPSSLLLALLGAPGLAAAARFRRR